MTLRDWLDRQRPGRGGLAWLTRASGVSLPVVAKALEGRPIARGPALRIAALTDGAVDPAQLVLGAYAEPGEP